MKTQLKHISDFINSAIKCNNTEERLNIKNTLALSDAKWLKDYRTIGFKLPNFSGANIWVHDEFIKDPDAILIVLDDLTKKQIIAVWNEIDATFEIPANIERPLPNSIINRILTIKDILQYCKNDDKPSLKDINKVYLNVKKYNKYISDEVLYSWLGKHILKSNGLIIITY